MVRIKLHSVIDSEDTRWYYEWFGGTGVFSLEYVQNLLAENKSETDFAFDIHCPGGNVEEGLAIYDVLRTSGKNIHMNIEGACHSMAVTLLLAAPKEYRTANANCSALIHQVQGGAFGNLSSVEAAVDDIRKAQNHILDIYADRTNLTREEAERIMNEEKTHTAQELLEWGFISSINAYNTNSKSNNMAKSLKVRATELLNSIQRFLGEKITNYEFVSAEGDVLFTTEAEDDVLEVGMAAEPDGSYTIQDGREVVIEGGVITAINEPDAGEPAEGDPNADEAEEQAEDNANLAAENERLAAENANLRTQLAEASNIIREYRSNIKSNYVVGNRVGSKSSANDAAPTSEERKQAVRDCLKKK